MLTDLGLYQKRQPYQYHWVRCSYCGEIDIKEKRKIGRQDSCGCREGGYKHGHSASLTYGVWATMKQRIENPNSPSFPRYGGRGITLDPAWQTFEGFLNDMGEKPGRATLDRIDNNQGYTKSNCRWASYKVQAQNTSRNVWLDFGDGAAVLQDIAAELCLSLSRIHKLRTRKGLTVAQAVQNEIEQRYGVTIYEHTSAT